MEQYSDIATIQTYSYIYMILVLSHDYLIGELISRDLGSSESIVGRNIPRLQVILPIYRTSITKSAEH